ncbi:hypothetical protein GCM10012289_22810 [Nonomuraea cavernae]|uniref:Tyr recombinase domain-containing protein n=1 Tax=Nonomuraea cavernae TaxID=2045107 RepID=A0A917YUM2_9ACTN|nr:hypothetical protein GCM10012289_22810 [Nonomuraea cavernae]
MQGGELPFITYRRAWKAARKATLTKEETASPLAARPYDLRHACVSTWLNAGVPAPQVAEWAGQSVDVLLRIYAKCIVGQDQVATVSVGSPTLSTKDRVGAVNKTRRKRRDS